MVNYKRLIILMLGMVFFLPVMIYGAEEYTTSDIKGKFAFKALNREPNEVRMGVYLFKDGKTTRLLKELSGSPSWSPDGKKIVCVIDSSFSSTGKKILPSDSRAIVIIDEHGTIIEKIEPPAPRAGEPLGWSPNGKYLVYTADESETYRWNKRLYLYDFGTKEHREILHLDGKYGIITLKWSPNSDKLLFNLSDEKAGLYIINIDGSGFTKLGRHGIAMGWFPDGRHIAYDANLDENDNFINKPGLVSIFKMNVDTKEAEEIRKSSFFMETYLSKDGKYIYYCKSGDEGGQAIFVSPIDNGTIQTQITHPMKMSSGSYSQDFSPDWYQGE